MRGRLDDGGVRLSTGTEGTEEDRASRDRQEHEAREEDVLPDRGRHEGDAVLPRELVVLLDVRRAADDPPWHRPLVDPELENEEEVYPDERAQQSGNDEHMQRENPRQRRAADDGASQEELHDRRADERDPARDRGPDAQAPVGVLVEPEHLPG